MDDVSFGFYVSAAQLLSTKRDRHGSLTLCMLLSYSGWQAT